MIWAGDTQTRKETEGQLLCKRDILLVLCEGFHSGEIPICEPTVQVSLVEGKPQPNVPCCLQGKNKRKMIINNFDKDQLVNLSTESKLIT